MSLSSFRVGNWLVEPVRNQIRGANGPTRIEPRLMRLLVMLAERSPDVVTREELTAEVWQGAFVTDEVLTQSVSELRRALGDDPREPRFVVTVPKRGYQLIAPVERMESESPEAEASSPRRERAIWILLTTLLLLGILYALRSPASRKPVRLAVAPVDSAIETLEISPDGTKLAYIALDSSGRLSIWTHELESGVRRSLPGTAGAWNLFWSPDSRSIGFSTLAALKTVEVDGGQVQTVQDNGFWWGGTWNDSGEMLVSQFGLHRVDAGGGEPKPLPQAKDGSSIRGVRPRFLPDGDHFLYFSSPSRGRGAIHVGSAETGESRFLADSDTKGVYADGFLLYVKSGALLAQRFDPESFRLGEEVHVIGAQSASPAVVGRTDAPFSASRNGTIVFRGSSGVVAELVWFDRDGRETGRVPPPESGEYTNPSFSPDGRWIAFNRRDPATADVDIWLVEVATNVASRFTSSPAPESDPVWSPDGKRIAFAAFRDGGEAIFVKDVAGGPEELLWRPPDRADTLLTDWSPDGRHILCFAGGETWVLPVVGEGEPKVVLRDIFEDDSRRVRTVHVYAARFSPDGEWIAYGSNETGLFEIYVMRAENGRDKQRISDQGGIHPAWRADGRELYYWGGPDFVGPLMRVSMEPGASGFRPSKPVPVGPLIAGLLDSRSHFAATPDGQRFLVRRPASDPSPITVMVDWTAMLDAR